MGGPVWWGLAVDGVWSSHMLGVRLESLLVHTLAQTVVSGLLAGTRRETTHISFAEVWVVQAPAGLKQCVWDRPWRCSLRPWRAGDGSSVQRYWGFW